LLGEERIETSTLRTALWECAIQTALLNGDAQVKFGSSARWPSMSSISAFAGIRNALGHHGDTLSNQPRGGSADKSPPAPQIRFIGEPHGSKFSRFSDVARYVGLIGWCAFIAYKG
jgi:hypothetical protein